MKRGLCVVLVVAAVVLSGCAGVSRTYVLTETESYYYIPAGTPFNAVVEKGKPPVEVRRTQDTWAVDAGYLVKLQEEANMAVLQPKR